MRNRTVRQLEENCLLPNIPVRPKQGVGKGTCNALVHILFLYSELF